MAKKNPLEGYIDQLRELFTLILDQRNTPAKDLPENINEQLEDLEKSIQAFVEFNERMLSAHGITDQEIKDTLNKKEQRNPAFQRILDKTKKLKEDVQVQSDLLKRTKEILQQHKLKYGNPNSPKSVIRKRQKRFRQFGGGDWIKS